jgi:transposase
MTRRARANHTPEFKSTVTLTAIKSEKTRAKLAQLFDVHPKQITTWKAQLLEGAGRAATPAMDLKALHAKIGSWRGGGFCCRRG